MSLQECGIPRPSYVVVDYEKVRRGEVYFYEAYDFLQVNGRRINKPFIEKPQEADRHDNWIYYPKNAGASHSAVSIHRKLRAAQGATLALFVCALGRGRLQDVVSKEAKQQQQLQPRPSPSSSRRSLHLRRISLDVRDGREGRKVGLKASV